MEKYIAELRAKSVEVGIMGEMHGVFFSHKLLAQSEKHGVVVDANALFGGHIDLLRALDEAIKVVYLGIIKYREIAEVLKIKIPASAPTLDELMVWAELDREQSAKAVSYIFEQLTLSVKSVAEQKKNLNESSSESEKIS